MTGGFLKCRIAGCGKSFSKLRGLSRHMDNHKKESIAATLVASQNSTPQR
jgi:hypothetical protein